MRFLILILFLTIIRVVFAGEPVGGDTLVVGAPDIRVVLDSLDLEAEVRQKVYRGKYHMVTEEGDTVLMLVMNPVTVFPPLKFKNKKQEQFYWRTVRDVKKTFHYAKLICATLL